MRRCCRDDRRLLILILFAGALGGLDRPPIVLLVCGNRLLRMSWLPMYCLLPVCGAVLAAVFFMVLRAGFASGTT